MNPQNKPTEIGLSQSSTDSRLESDTLAVKRSNLSSVYFTALALIAAYAGGAICSHKLFLYLPGNLAHFAPGIASIVGIGIGLAYIVIAGRDKNIKPEIITIDRKKEGGFTLVEMLAVLAVMAVICALTVPSGIFARGTGEVHLARANAAAFEMGKSNYLARYGAEAGTNWSTAYQADPSIGHMYNLLAGAGCFPPEWSHVYAGSSAEQSFQGYQVVVPATIAQGVAVFGPDSQQVYPE